MESERRRGKGCRAEGEKLLWERAMPVKETPPWVQCLFVGMAHSYASQTVADSSVVWISRRRSMDFEQNLTVAGVPANVSFGDGSACSDSVLRSSKQHRHQNAARHYHRPGSQQQAPLERRMAQLHKAVGD